MGHSVHVRFGGRGLIRRVANQGGASSVSWWRQGWPRSRSMHRSACLRGSGKASPTSLSISLPFFVVAALSVVLGAAVGVLATPGAIQADQPETAPPPIATVVTPVVATVTPVEDVVTPITGMAEASTGSAQRVGSEAEGSDNPFSGVRGGFIGAAIALGLVVLATVAVRGARTLGRQRHQ